jgi:hypothetical protein
VAAVTIETIQRLKFESLCHISYSPDLVPSQYHTFRLFKSVLHGHQLSYDEEVKDVVHAAVNILHKWHQEVLD